MRYYASGYYYAAKRQRTERVAAQRYDHIGVPAAAVSRRPVAIKNPADAQAQQVPEPQAGANAPKPR